MALVSYDYSGSENEEEEEDNSTSAVILIQDQQQINNKDGAEENELTEENSISKLLPKTKLQPANIVEDQLEDFVPKYEPSAKQEKPKKKVKISIPSLSDFQDDDNDEEEEPQNKKMKTVPKSSGLLSLLPPVRGSPLSTKSFVPQAVTHKSTNKPARKKTSSLIPDAVQRKAEIEKKIAQLQKKMSSNESDDDDDGELETFDEEMWQKVCGRPKPAKKIIESVEPTPSPAPIIIDAAPEPVKPYEGLDNEAFKELVGKNRRPHMNYKLVDINEDEIVSDKNLWLTKSLTDPDQEPEPVIENPVDPTRKKKHHITYLAEQAKANEQQLQSTWSANKYTRTQTRAKYGF